MPLNSEDSCNSRRPNKIPPRVLKWTESLTAGLPLSNLKTSPYVRSLPPGLGLATLFDDNPKPAPKLGPALQNGNSGCKRSNSSSSGSNNSGHNILTNSNSNFLSGLKRRMSLLGAAPVCADRYGCNFNNLNHQLALPNNALNSADPSCCGCCRECGCPFPPNTQNPNSNPNPCTLLIDQVSRLFRGGPTPLDPKHSRQNSYSSCSFSSSGYSSSSNFSLYPPASAGPVPARPSQPEPAPGAAQLGVPATDSKATELKESTTPLPLPQSVEKGINLDHEGTQDHELVGHIKYGDCASNEITLTETEAGGREEEVRCVDSGICLISDNIESIHATPLLEITETGEDHSGPSRTTTPSLVGSVCSSREGEQEDFCENRLGHPPPNYEEKCKVVCPCLCHELYAYGLLSHVEPTHTSPYDDDDDQINLEHEPGPGQGGLKTSEPDAQTLRHTPSSTTSLTSAVLASINRRLACKSLSSASNSLLPTSRLILENRPKNLPPKQPEEELKHKSLYNAMIEAAKKKEVKETKVKKKLLVQKLKAEEKLAHMAKIWNTEIIPNWESMRCHKKTRALMSAGIPPSVRGKVWCLAIGNDLNITNDLYDICVARSKERMAANPEPACPNAHDHGADPTNGGSVGGNYEESLRLIQLDVSRTFPNLCIFQKGAPYHELLHDLLSAYVSYRPDVGYVQGMSFIAAVLLLNMEVKKAFICFANLLNGPCFQAFFRMDQCAMGQYFDSYRKYFRFNLPKLYDHFEKLHFNPDLYLTDWIYTIYSKSLHLDVACRLWDVFLRDGQEFLFRTALGILKLYEDILLKMDFMQLAEYLTKLEDPIAADTLFDRIATIDMGGLGGEKKGLSQLLTNSAPRSFINNSPLT